MWVCHSGDPGEIACDVAVQEGQGPQKGWFAEDSPGALGEHEERVIARDVISAAVFKGVVPYTVCCAGGTVMDERDIGKGVCVPAQHVCLYFIHGVPARGCQEAA